MLAATSAMTDSGSLQETFAPATVVFRATADWFTMRAPLLRLAASHHGALGHMRIRAGRILAPREGTHRVTYGPHEGDGRHLQRWSPQHRPARESEYDARLNDALTPLRDAPTFQGHRILGHEAVSFSSIAPSAIEEIIRINALASHAVAFGTFDPDDSVLAELLWTHLIPIAVISHGRILEAIEDAPDVEFGPHETFLIGTPPTDVGSAAFYEAPNEGIIVDRRAQDWAMPDRLDVAPPPTVEDTPVGVVMRHAHTRTTPRISSEDDPVQPATVDRSLAFLEYPDVNVIERKVIGFLLAPDQEKQRWVEFANHGYRDSGTTGLVIASLLSSVLYSSFEASDIRATADSALQFSVPMLLPSPRGSYLPLQTAWTFRNEPGLLDQGADLTDARPGALPPTGLWLHTAYPARNLASYSSPLRSPIGPNDEDWGRLDAFIRTAGGAVASQVKANVYSTMGWLWVPRLEGRQARFYRWLLANKSPLKLRRKAMGGQVAQYRPLLTSLAGESEISAGLRLAQTLLGMVGIRSFVHLHFD